VNGPSLLDSVHQLLERTYLIRSGVDSIGRFVIGDAGYRHLYRGEIVETVGTEPKANGQGARTLIRETPDGLAARIYYPDAMIRCLEAYPPHQGLGDANVDAFAVLVEEADHLLCIAERAREERPVSLFELELHANVSKHLVLTRFLAGVSGRLDNRRRAWLRFHLFHKGAPSDTNPAVRGRYADAVRWALRMLDASARLRPAERVLALRQFHSASAHGKLELIGRLSAR